MKTNLMLFFGGVFLALVGLYRIFPIKLRGPALFPLIVQTLPLGLAFVIALVWTFRIGGLNELEKGFLGSFRVTASFFPVIALLFPLIAFGGVIASHYQSNINAMLMGKSGPIGTLIAAFVVPTTNAVAEPVKMCWENPSFRPLLLYFLNASSLVCWPILFFRILGLTPEIGVKMYLTNWVVAISLLLPFWLWSRLIAPPVISP